LLLGCGRPVLATAQHGWRNPRSLRILTHELSHAPRTNPHIPWGVPLDTIRLFVIGGRKVQKYVTNDQISGTMRNLTNVETLLLKGPLHFLPLLLPTVRSGRLPCPTLKTLVIDENGRPPPGDSAPGAYTGIKGSSRGWISSRAARLARLAFRGSGKRAAAIREGRRVWGRCRFPHVNRR